MSPGLRGRSRDGRAVASYHPSCLPGLYCATLIDEGPPRALVHDRFVLLTFTSGHARVWSRGETHALAAGTVLMLEPGDVHRDVQKTSYSAVLVALKPDRVEGLRGPDEGLRFAASVARCAALCAESVALVEAVRAGHEREVQERQAARLFESLAPFWARTAPRAEPPLVARARRALTDSPRLSLDELASRLRCAPTYLCRVFSEHIGVGPHAYQLQQRLLEARRLIEDGRSVAKAAALTGFSDASHLRRHFRHRFAAAPARYQRELAALASG